jgi:hypothetical protein
MLAALPDWGFCGIIWRKLQIAVKGTMAVLRGMNTFLFTGAIEGVYSCLLPG